MDFLTLLTTFTDKGFEWIGIALLVWLLVVYLPKRDHAFLAELNNLRQTMEQAERAAHDGIIELIQEHDKHALEANLKIAQILQTVSFQSGQSNNT